MPIMWRVISLLYYNEDVITVKRISLSFDLIELTAQKLRLEEDIKIILTLRQDYLVRHLAHEFVAAISQKLDYLHDIKIIHRHFKQINIMLTSPNCDTCSLILVDLGCIRQLTEEVTKSHEVSHNKGTYS